jgi:hypothetical protein
MSKHKSEDYKIIHIYNKITHIYNKITHIYNKITHIYNKITHIYNKITHIYNKIIMGNKNFYLCLLLLLNPKGMTIRITFKLTRTFIHKI